MALAALPDEALLVSDTIGRFSIADLLVLLTAWEAELVTGLMKLDQKRKPGGLLTALANRESYEQKRFNEHKGRDLDRIFDDLQQVRVELERWLEHFSQRDLTDPKRFKWFNGRSLADVIATVTYKNEATYIPPIETFAEAWLAREQDSSSIPLTAVSVNHEQENHDEQPD